MSQLEEIGFMKSPIFRLLKTVSEAAEIIVVELKISFPFSTPLGKDPEIV